MKRRPAAAEGAAFFERTCGNGRLASHCERQGQAASLMSGCQGEGNFLFSHELARGWPPLSSLFPDLFLAMESFALFPFE